MSALSNVKMELNVVYNVVAENMPPKREGVSSVTIQHQPLLEQKDPCHQLTGILACSSKRVVMKRETCAGV